MVDSNSEVFEPINTIHPDQGDLLTYARLPKGSDYIDNGISPYNQSNLAHNVKATGAEIIFTGQSKTSIGFTDAEDVNGLEDIITEHEVLGRIRTSKSTDVAITGVAKVPMNAFDTSVIWSDTPAATRSADEVNPEHVTVDAVIQNSQETVQDKPNKLLAFMGGTSKAAKLVKNHVANRVANAFALRDETSHRLNPRTTAVLTASALLLGALGYVHPPQSHNTTDKTEQTTTTLTPNELVILRSHMPKVEIAPHGAWVPPTMWVWEQDVPGIMHSPEFQAYDLVVDERLVLAVMTAVSVGNPGAEGHNGRLGLMQETQQQGELFVRDFNPKDEYQSMEAGILDLDLRAKNALKDHDYSQDRAGFIHAIIEGPAPGMGFEPIPDYAKSLATKVIDMDANWSNAASDEYAKLIKDDKAQKLLNDGINTLLSEGLLKKVSGK